MNNLLNHVAQVFRWILKSHFLKYRSGFSRILLRSLEVIYRASERLRTEIHHFTLLLPNCFPAMVLVLVPLPKPCTSKIRST